jgi:hypothetical protein
MATVRGVETERLLEDAVEVTVDHQAVKDFVASNFAPEDVYPTKDLETWAEDNGYTKGE